MAVPPVDYEPLAPIRTTAPAEREQAKAVHLGECDYPGEDFVPCWCSPATINTRGGCDSAAEYLESVQQFGQPRFFVSLPPY